MEVLGVTIGGLVTLAAVYAGYWLEKGRVERKEIAQRISDRAHLAGALLAELRSLRERYMEVAGAQIERAQTYRDFAGYTSPGFNYFSVFDGNTSRLGMLEIGDAELVVNTYVRAKGHLDGLRMWGEIVLPTRNLQVMEAFFNQVKRDHNTLKGLFDKVQPRLQAYIDGHTS